MASLLEFIQDKAKGVNNSFQSDYRNEVDNLIALAFPSTAKPSNTRVNYSRTDTDNMSPEEYNKWFQGQGAVAESHPLAAVLGGARLANLARKVVQRKKVSPSPTTAPLALTDQSQAPVNAPLDPGPTEPLMLEAPLADTNYYSNEEMLQMGYSQENINDMLQDEFGDQVFEDIDFGENVYDDDNAWGDEYNEDLLMGAEVIPNPLSPDLELPISNEEFYTKPEGFYSALEKKAEGGNLSKEEKDSAIREIKYRTMASDAQKWHWDSETNSYLDNLWREIMDDPRKSPYDYFDYDEQGNLLEWKDFVLKDLPADKISNSVPNINDPESLKEFMDKNPLQFTVRHSKDQYGDGLATHLYFGGTKPNEKSRQHFETNQRPAQAFIRYNTDEGDGFFNVVEVQNEMRGGGDAYAKQVVSKLAQQTVLDWSGAQRYEDTISIPTGEKIFKFYQSNLGFGRPLWPEEMELLKLKDNDKFDEQASEFYNKDLMLNEASKAVKKDIKIAIDIPDYDWEIAVEEYGQEYVDRVQKIANEIKNHRAVGSESYSRLEKIQTNYKINFLKGSKEDYQGKVKHYNEYVKQLKKSLKQHGADIEEIKEKNFTIIKVLNPEKTRRNTNDNGFTIAMDIPKEKSKRRVA